MPSPDAAVHVLLVEGQDDKHVVLHICQRYDNPPTFDILDKEGIDPLLKSIGPEVKVPDRETVGIVVDANTNFDARWQAIRSRLRDAGISAPSTIDPSGIIIDGKPRVGVWLMPDNASPGELEDFVAAMIPQGDSVWPLAQSYIAGIRAPEFAAGKVRRAEVHAWLATRADPRQMGTAIKARDLDIEVKACQLFVRWLRSLFSPG